MYEVKLNGRDLWNFVKFMKTFENYQEGFDTHEIDVNGYHVRLYEGDHKGNGNIQVVKNE